MDDAPDVSPQDVERRSPLWLVMRLGAFALVLALLGLLVWRVVAARRGSDLVANVRAHRKPRAPDFALKVLWPEAITWPSAPKRALIDGQLHLSELRGHPVVLNFWASWCIPCKAEAPRLVAAAKQHRGRVLFVGIDIQDFKSDARRFLTRYDVNYVSVRDSSEDTYRQYGLTGVPETYYVNDGGRVVAHSLGGLSLQELERGIAAITEGTG